MKITQLVHTLNYGDAISSEVVTLHRVFQEMGLESEVISIHSHEKMKGYSQPMSEVNAASHQTDKLLLHYSLGSPLNELFRNSKAKEKLLLYHNLTPPAWFSSYNTRVYNDLESGLAELPGLLDIADRVLADSSYNKEELVALGASEVELLPLPLDFKKWDIEANTGIAAALRGHGGVNILHVGRIAPNKCLEDIIKTFYFYHHKINPQSKLWLIGHDIDCEIYSLELRRLVSELSLKPSVEFVGSVSDGELKAFYENSEAYLCMSEHEGFCVPMLEAMNFSLPIVSYASTAIPETVGNAGLLFDKKEHHIVAEALDHVILNQDGLRDALVKAGLERIKNFQIDNFRELVNKTVVSERPSNELARKAG